ncbi:MAG TPA: methyltransferase domain-containing protein, partial [Acetobacteraceae bacterium]|nr:methyltransferase domain-containing protein [Acetobacteraceae bacterium]
ARSSVGITTSIASFRGAVRSDIGVTFDGRYSPFYTRGRGRAIGQEGGRMVDDADLTIAQRLAALWGSLGLQRAHVATQMAGDLAGFAQRYADRLAGVVLCVPARLDPAPFAAVADRLVMIAGERGLTAEATARAAARLPGSRRVVLADYDAPGWADVVAERTAEIGSVLESLTPILPDAGLAACQRVHAGITYKVEGQGPPLVLFPFFLAPSQWEPVIPRLARRFTVITLGGRHLGGIAALEDRAQGPSYQGMVRTLLDVIAPAPGDAILDVGCGSGAVDRMLMRRLPAGTRLTATDINPFLLKEAASLAEQEGLSKVIRFLPANAEALPFPDQSFDHAFTVTVLEECDADRALAELFRVVRPGGRVGVIVRSIDLPQWWHLDLPESIRAKVDQPPPSVGPKGIADASLYSRMRAAGFVGMRCFPSLVTFDNPDGPIWKYREDHVLSLLSPEETVLWQQLASAARRDGLLFMAHPMHCAVGTRPATSAN